MKLSWIKHEEILWYAVEISRRYGHWQLAIGFGRRSLLVHTPYVLVLQSRSASRVRWGLS